MIRLSPLALACTLALALLAGPMASAVPLTDDPVPLRVTVEDGQVAWTPSAALGAIVIEVSGPGGVVAARAFDGGDAATLDLATLGLPDGAYTYRAIVPEADDSRATIQQGQFAWTAGIATISDAAPTVLRDQLINDDLIVLQSACVGVDCVNGESFGFDTVRLKENNLRLHFQDTSSSASFPGNDWRIVINDSNNGGANYFAVEDATAGAVPFRIAAGAGADALVVSGTGDVGLGTAAPALELHVADGDTPALRLGQTGTQGFSPYSWDVAGNEAGFFVRDATVNTLPLRVLPGAPSDAFRVESDGSVALRAALAAGDVAFSVTNATGNAQLLALDGAGNLTTSGTVNGSSSVHLKTDFLPIDNAGVLAGVRSLPLSTWRYRADAAGVHHLGPTSQDFRAAFGLGASDTAISMADADGVALASIQALAAENDDLRARLATLERLVAELTARDQ